MLYSKTGIGQDEKGSGVSNMACDGRQNDRDNFHGFAVRVRGTQSHLMLSR